MKHLQSSLEPKNIDVFAEDIRLSLSEISKISGKKDNVVVAPHSGLDEYYILPGAQTVENDSNLDDELIGATKGKLTSAFKKSSKGRLQSRVLLNKFVKMVA